MPAPNTWASTATQAYPVATLSNATSLGALPASTSMHIVVGLQEQNPDQVQPTLRAMLTPGNALYGTSLTVQQFVTQFGATSAQVQAVEDYLTSAGFTNVTAAPNQLLVEADGTAGIVETAFNVSLAQYSVNGATVYANTSPAQVPQSLSGTVLAVLGLNNIVHYHTDLTNGSSSPPSKATDPCTPPVCNTPAQPLADTAFGPADYQIAYDAACPSDNAKCPAEKFPPASCVTIGSIAEGEISQTITDLANYETAFDLPKVPVTAVYAGIASPDTSGQVEWDLDSQSSTGIAQNVEHYYFYVATSLTDSDLGLAINKWATDDKARLLSISIGECEFFPYLDGAMVLDDEMFGEAALQGQTAFASSDDNGSACPSEAPNGVPLGGPPDTSYPASSPYVIASGGTQLFTNADYTYDFEVGWYAGGGGPSYFETSPFWQSYTGSGTAPIVVSSEAGQRGVPDVAMCADPNICGAYIFSGGPAGAGSNESNGSYCCYGGTSLASPLSMGAWARIEAAHDIKTGKYLGFAGPLIYQLANGAPTLNSPYFNDVTLGANGAYSAGLGYDYVTGLGSWDIYEINKVIPSTYPQ